MDKILKYGHSLAFMYHNGTNQDIADQIVYLNMDNHLWWYHQNGQKSHRLTLALEVDSLVVLASKRIYLSQTQDIP